MIAVAIDALAAVPVRELRAAGIVAPALPLRLSSEVTQGPWATSSASRVEPWSGAISVAAYSRVKLLADAHGHAVAAG